jgi:hypothetical protein
MSNPFADLDAALSGAVGDAFGEQAVISPRIAGEFGSTVDPARPARTVRGVYSSGPMEGRIASDARGTFQGQTRAIGQSATLWIAAATISALPYGIRKGDRVNFPARPNLAFDIVAFEPTDLGDIELSLNAVKP